MQLDDYDGASAIAAAWADGLRPDPTLTVSAWADKHRVLSPRGANEAGPWRTARTPYLKEIMDHLSPSHPCQRVVFMKGAQTGGTEAGNNFLGYVIHHAPGPMLAVQPTVELAKRFSQQRVEPLIEASPMLRERVAPARSRDSGNTVLSKTFPGGILVLTGANSAVGLRSMPARYLFLDEVDAYPPSADEEGDPVALAEARTRTFAWRRKVFLVSTPTIKGTSRIEREYEASDQRRFFVGCPHCGHRQWLTFERLRWDKHRPDTAAYHCEGCDERIEERHKTATQRVAVENALLHRYDPGRHELSEPAREWRGLSLIEMARSLLEAAGERQRGLSRDEIATRALHSTSDFPHILAAVTGKTLRAAYDAAPRTFMPIARRTSAADFKQIHRLQLGEAPQLEKVNESGEFKRGSIGEGKESYGVETWGKVIGITRQVIINDDLDAFTRVPALFGTSAATLESDIVWGIVIDNPAMADGNALFHGSHKNLAGTGTALDVPSLGKARTAMAKQTGLDGKTLLNLRPTFLVVPAALELMAEQLIAQSLVPAKTTDVVPNSIRSLAVIAEPRLDPASGAVPWFLFASPASIDTIEYAYLEGQDGVFIESRTGFDVDGVEIKARLDFGAKAIDWRGMFKNAGVTLS